MIDAVLGWFESALTFLHSGLEPVFGAHAWGWSIVALTLIVRVALLPLAIKQTRSMRAMQAVQPQLKELQKKYKVDRDLLRKDPELYRQRRQKLNEEQMALFQKEGTNPMASCLPLLAQAPIFLALFWTLRGQSEPGAPLFEAPFYFFTRFVSQSEATDPVGLAATVSNAGWPGWLLILLMSGSMFVSQKQMMARNAAQMPDGPAAQQQKILLYVMPIFLAVISFQFPLGILLYWVTTNMWQVAQQTIILREVRQEARDGTLGDKPGGGAAKRWAKRKQRELPEATKPESTGRSKGATSGRSSSDGKKPGSEAGPGSKDTNTNRSPRKDRSEPSGDENASSDGAGARSSSKRDHIPRRGGSSRS